MISWDFFSDLMGYYWYISSGNGLIVGQKCDEMIMGYTLWLCQNSY